jgi:hypothetical protein
MKDARYRPSAKANTADIDFSAYVEEPIPPPEDQDYRTEERWWLSSNNMRLQIIEKHEDKQECQPDGGIPRKPGVPIGE